VSMVCNGTQSSCTNNSNTSSRSRSSSSSKR
jgi:hypothetical protein